MRACARVQATFPLKCLQHPDKSCYPSELKASIKGHGNLSLCPLGPLLSHVIYCVDVAAKLQENKYIQIQENSGKIKLLTEPRFVSLLSSLFPHAAFGCFDTCRRNAGRVITRREGEERMDFSDELKR